jgi:hypothetical protein
MVLFNLTYEHARNYQHCSSDTLLFFKKRQFDIPEVGIWSGIGVRQIIGAFLNSLIFL